MYFTRKTHIQYKKMFKKLFALYCCINYIPHLIVNCSLSYTRSKILKILLIHQSHIWVGGSYLPIMRWGRATCLFLKMNANMQYVIFTMFQIHYREVCADLLLNMTECVKDYWFVLWKNFLSSLLKEFRNFIFWRGNYLQYPLFLRLCYICTLRPSPFYEQPSHQSAKIK